MVSIYKLEFEWKSPQHVNTWKGMEKARFHKYWIESSFQEQMISRIFIQAYISILELDNRPSCRNEGAVKALTPQSRDSFFL